MPDALSRSTIPRRDLLRGACALGLGLGLAGCQIETSSPQSSDTPSPGLNLSGGSADLPSEDVTLRWLNGGPGPKTYFFREFLAAYRDEHPNVKVQYDELPNNKIAEVLPLQLRSGDVADVFLIPPNVPISELAAAGRLAPLDDVIPDFAEWKENFPFGTLTPGVQIFDGTTYAITPSSDRRSTLLLYNSAYLEQAGYDPANEPLTWDDFRAAAKKITKQGAGEYYGLVLPGIFQGVVYDLAQLSNLRIAHVRAGGIDWKTGEFNYHGDEMIGLMELLKAIIADGSLFPGWASLKDEEARARMAQGAGGMLLSGPWNFPVWKEQNPDFRYGVARHPVPEDVREPSTTFEVGGSNQFAVYADAADDAKAVAGDMLYYLGTEEGQRAWNVLTGAADPAWSQQALEEVLSSDEIDEPNRAALGIFDDTVRLGPSPLVRNPDNEKVELALVPAKPNLGQVVQGILTGELTDPAKALRDLSGRCEQALNAAIAEASSQGAQVSRDDWVFPNWDPTKDYVQADYEQLT